LANYTTAADLLDDILWRAGELTTAGDRTSDMATQALTYLNRVYQALCLGGGELLPDMYEDWWWLWKTPPGVLTLVPAFTTGTVSVTNNSTSGSFSAAPVDGGSNQISVEDWFIRVKGNLPGNGDVFRISSHTLGDTAFTLDSVFTGATSTAAGFDCFKLEYALPASDILRLISPLRQYRTKDPQYDIELIDAMAMDASYPLASVEGGAPTRAAIVNIDSSNTHTLRFNRYGGTETTDYMRVEYDYLYAPSALTDSALSIPAVPHFYRRVLSDWAVYFLLTDKNDDRAVAAGQAAKAGLRAMQLENKKRLGTAGRFRMGHLAPRADLEAHDWSGPLRTSSGLIIG